MLLGTPGFLHNRVIRVDPGRRGRTVGFAAFSLLPLGVLTWCLLSSTNRWPDTWPPVGPVTPDTVLTVARGAALATILLLVLVAWNGYRWYVARAVELLLSGDPAQGDVPVKTPGPPGPLAPPQPLPRLLSPKLPRLHELRQVDRRSNVTGRPPLRLGYLRVFENNARTAAFAGDAWREFGYVHMLRSASAVRPHELRQLRHHPEGGMVTDLAQLDAAFRDGLGEPFSRGAHLLRTLSSFPVWTWDWYGAYPCVTPLCHGRFWREAVDELLTRVDVLLLDLSGLRNRNKGTLFEVQRVVDRYPVERVLFLADPWSNNRYLTEVIHHAWRQMAADSPNGGPWQRRVCMARTDRFVLQVTTNQDGSQTYRRRLRPQRRRTRRLAAWLQDRAATAPPVPPRRPRALAAVHTPVRPRRPRRPVLLPALLTIGVLAGLSSVTGLYVETEAVISDGTAPVAEGPDLPPGPQPPAPQPQDSPAPGTRPHAPVAVPPVAGLNLEAAEARVIAADLTIGREVEVLSPQQAGTVLGSTPKAGALVDPGSAIDLSVASGQNTVPDVRRQSHEAATFELREAGFTVAVAPREGDADAGTVVDQVPAPGEERDVGTTVTIFVSSGSSASTTTPTPPAEATTESSAPPTEGDDAGIPGG